MDTLIAKSISKNAIMMEVTVTISTRIIPTVRTTKWPYEIGNKNCDGVNNVEECGYDGGDCKVANYPECRTNTPNKVDGICDKNSNKPECDHDGGDCHVPNYPDCFV